MVAASADKTASAKALPADSETVGICPVSSTFVGNVTYGYDADGHRIAEGGKLVRTTLLAAQSGNVYNADNELTAFGGTASSYDPDGNLLSDGPNSYNWNDYNLDYVGP